jgi:hypothetical protein
MLAFGLEALVTDLRHTDALDNQVLRELRGVVDRVRFSAWLAAELLNVQRGVSGAELLLEVLASERVSRLQQNVEDLCIDIETGRMPLHGNSAERLLHTASRLSSVLVFPPFGK